MRFGYARVSSEEQNLDRQINQLEKAGCQVIYEEKISGATMERKQLQALLDVLTEGDEIFVTDLTRITRSTQDLFSLVEQIRAKGAALQSLKDTWLDMSSDNPYSTFLLTVMAGVNQLERDLTRMRQREGIELAKAKGKYVGRVRKYSDKHKGMNAAIEAYLKPDRTESVRDICETYSVSQAGLYRELKRRKES